MTPQVGRGIPAALPAALMAAVLAGLVALGRADEPAEPSGPSPSAAGPLRIVVMDPLSNRLACDCVAGYARRNYQRLGQFLEKTLRRRVAIAYSESLDSPHARASGGMDLIAGKFSEVVFDAAHAGLRVRPVAMLSGKDGQLTQTGLFVVREADAARSIEDLKGRRILFGPAESLEKHSAALATMEAFDLPSPDPLPTSPSCNAAALAVVEEAADAAVISSYAMPLLAGCGTIDKGSLRIVGRTDPVPFIGLFATDRVGGALRRELAGALAAVAQQTELLAALESKRGFVRLRAADGQGNRWPDWRGPRRDAISADVPQSLPAEKRLLWQRTLTGQGMAGLAVDRGRIVVADKDLDQQQDIFRCLDAQTGRQLWKLAYPAAGDMDFTNSPRANPVIHEGLVYLLGAFGDLHCVQLAGGRVVWKKNLLAEFGAERPQWGTCSTPLIVDDKLIVNPGAAAAAVVALDRRSGAVRWATPGDPAGYGSFILAELGGRRQIVGYDAVSLGGWDVQTGTRLWRLVPEVEGDFNVPTPVVTGGQLLLSTENNGTRLYRFDHTGRIDPQPVAVNEDLIPDTSTPVVLDGLVFGACGRLICLDRDNGLKTLWEVDTDPFAYYCSFIAGNGRVLAVTQSGTLCLLRATRQGFAPLVRLELFGDVAETDRDVWSHPALVGGRLYVRNLLGVTCFLIE